MTSAKSSVIAALALAGGMFAASAHAGGVSWSVNIGIPAPVYYAPPPVVYAPPPPVYYEPAPVYYAPPPRVRYYRPRPVAVYGPPPVVYRHGPPAIVGGSWQRHPQPHWHDRPGRGGHYGDVRGEGRRGGW